MSMKICFATNYLPEYHRIWGGAEQACCRLLNLLVKNGQELSVLSTEPIKEVKGNFGFYSIPILKRFLGKEFPRCWLSFDPRVYFHSYRALKKIKPDILHLHNVDVLSFSLVLSAKRLGIPVFFSIYDYWCICPRKILVNNKGERCRKYHGSHCSSCIGYKRYTLLFRRKFFDYIFNKINTFIVLSRSSAKILRDYGIKEEKIVIVQLPLFEKFNIKEDKFEKNTILFVGWVQPHKGLHILLEAMPTISKVIPDVKLYVIATGEESKIEELIKKYKLEKYIFSLGKVPHEVVKEYLQKANVVVIPEQWENVGPLFLGEAMAFAKPIIASSIGAIPEYIKDGKSGFLVEPKDSLEFAKKIIWLFKNRESALKMGKEAQDSARRIFDENKILGKLLSLYSKKR